MRGELRISRLDHTDESAVALGAGQPASFLLLVHPAVDQAQRLGRVLRLVRTSQPAEGLT